MVLTLQQQQPNLPSLPHRPHSTTPLTYHHHTTPAPAGSSAQSLSPNYPTKRTSPFTPSYSQTPTFKRLTQASPHHRSRSSPMHGKSHTGDDTPATRESVKIQRLTATTDEIVVTGEHENLRPHTVDGSRLHSSLAKFMSSKRAHSRRVWDKGSGPGSPKVSSNLKSSPSARNSQRAKYTPHHIPDPNSRCASSMVSSLSRPPSLFSYCLFLVTSGPSRSRQHPGDV